MNIVITGSTEGIGRGLAAEFLKKGHNVLINGRTEEKCLKRLTEFRSQFPSGTVFAYACDVSDYSSVDRMYDYAEDKLGSVHIWINNAGMDQNRQCPWDHDVEAMHRIIDVNIKGVVNGTRAASRRMVDSGGFIYNMEGFGSNGMMAPKMSFYGMSKRAVTYFTRSAAKEASGSKVKICRLSPGMVLTDLIRFSLPEDPEERRKASRVFHVLADEVETVTPFLVNGILKNRRNNGSVAWLTNGKIILRFLLQPLRKRKLPGLE